MSTIFFWDISKPLSYNKLFNFIVGGRSTGKTYGAKNWAIKTFLKNKSQFVYVRRYEKSDLKYINNFFDDIEEKYSGHKFYVKGNEFYIDEEIGGYAIALSKATSLKSVPFPKVDKIIFDEFIIDNGKQRYLKNEVEAFLELYVTIARERDVRVLFLSNAISVSNPYFIYFNLALPYNKNFLVKDEILLEMVEVDGFKERRSQSRFGNLIKDTKYYDYSIDNKFLLDSPEFIMKKSGNSQYFFTINYKNQVFGVWIDKKLGLVFISEKYIEDYPLSYALTTEDHKQNTLLVGKMKPIPIKTVCRVFQNGGVRFENQKTKNIMLEMLKL